MKDLVITPETPVGEIAESLPGSTEVFRRAGIGFCCGGDESLSLAARHNGADLAAVMDALRRLQARSANVPPTETMALIDHILGRFHDVHREELEWLIPLAQKVETVHGDHDEAPLGLTEALIALAEDLDSHMAREEEALFPMMRAGGNPMIVHPIARMRDEHDVTDTLLANVLSVTRDLDLPAGACRSWTALYTGLRKFADDLKAHMHLENEVLFPRYESA
jgi:regulator of cell morphogenesis and NO signaling